MKFSLTIAVDSLSELTEVVNKLGDSALKGTIQHEQSLDQSAPAAAPAPKKRSKKEPEIVIPTAPAVVPTTPFPGIPAPTDFSPGVAAAPAMAQPAPQPYVAPVQPQAPAPSAPVMQAPPAPAPAPVSEVRQQWNNACIELINALGQVTTMTDQDKGKVIAQSFTEANCAGKITTISDAQIQALYPILHKNVNAALQQTAVY